MKNKKSEKVTKAYEKIKEKHPDICDENEIEMLTRKYLMRKNFQKSAGLFLGGSLSYLLMGIIFDNSLVVENPFISLFINLLKLISSVMVIVGVCVFVKSLHDPLTPKEAQELAEKDKIEKG